MSKRYDVTIPFSGHIVITVEAENEEQAIDKAFDTSLRLKTDKDSIAEIGDWDMHKHVGRGNVCEFNEPWEATADLIDDSD